MWRKARDCHRCSVDSRHEPKPSDAALVRLAAHQHGIFSRPQALAAGLKPTTLDGRVDRGDYERIARGVFRIAGCPTTWQQAVMSTVLSVGPDAVASNATAGYLHGLIEGRPKRIEVTDHRSRVARSREAAIVHRSRDLYPHHLEVVDGIPATNAARTVVDLARTWRSVTAEALDRGKRLELYDWNDVARIVIEVARQGRSGVVLMRELLVRRTDHLGRTESELEDQFLHRLTQLGVPKPIPQYVVRDLNGSFVCRADFAYAQSKTLIELDSQQWHGDAAATKADRTKQNRLVALGYHVYRYTWWHCRFDYHQMCRDMQLASGASSPHNPVSGAFSLAPRG